jgi:threonine/homoserine/homoserine lactone efflux protein
MSPGLPHGLVIGFTIAMPFGPISLICVQRALGQGLQFAIASGLGAATAHGVFSALARASSNVLGALLADFGTPIHLLSGTVIVLFGVRVIRTASTVSGVTTPRNLLASYGATLLLALCNPMTILPYLAYSTAAGLPVLSLRSLFASLGVMLGAMSWYLILSSATYVFRREISATMAGRLNLVGGGVLIGFGIGISVGLL